jgi:hypothetical protein
MVLVEGVELNAEYIPKSKLVTTWKTLSNEPFPRIKALRLIDEDFDHVIQHRRCFEDDLCEMEEWGRLLSVKGTDACVFNASEEDEADYIILVRKTPYHTLDEILLHELLHIAKGDL